MTRVPRSEVRLARCLLAAGVVAALTLVGCGAKSGSESSPDPLQLPRGIVLKPAASTPLPANPSRHTGPQGRVGQFVVTCTYSHSASDDPIVHFDHPGRSHHHDFYGSVATKATSTIGQLRRADTTCNKSVDTAAYWQPTLYDHEKAVRPIEAQAYYRAAPGIDPKSVKTMPVGLAMIAGDATSTTPQPGDATGWTCGARTSISDDLPECPASAPLHLVLTFQDCWDGKYVDSVDHRSHVASSSHGSCPSGFPVSIPQLAVSIKFPVWGPGHDLTLASGNIYSAHGDFWNAWDPAGLEREINVCIRRGVVCDLASNREEEPLFSG